MARPRTRWETSIQERAFVATDAAATSVFGGDTGPRRGSNNVLKAYETSPRIQAIFDLISETMASLPVRGYQARSKSARNRILHTLRAADVETRRTGIDHRRRVMARLVDREELIEVTRSPTLDLIHNPMNMARSWSMTSWEWRVLINNLLELTGNAWMLALGDNPEEVSSPLGPRNQPVELLPIPDPWVTIREDGTYDIHGNGGMIRWVQIHHSRMLCVKRHRPANPYGRGIGKAQTLADEIDVDESAARYLAALLVNNGTPHVLMQIEHSTPEQRKQMQLDLMRRHHGVANAGRPMISSGKIDIKNVGHKPSELELLEERQFSSDVMRESVGVPPEQMGQIENSNRATVRESYSIMARNVLVPRCRRMDDFYTMRLGRLFEGGDTLIIAHDSPIPADTEAEEAARAAAPWALTVNEWRAKQGLEPDPSPFGEMVMVESGAALLPKSQLTTMASATIEAQKNQNKPQPAASGAKPAEKKPAPKKT